MEPQQYSDEPTGLARKLVGRLMHQYFRFARGLTLGVRAVVLDGEGRVFLVRHTYVGGWHFPGGGVEAGETMGDALARELMEEGNIAIEGTPQLHGMFFNNRATRRDHVGVYVIRDFTQGAPRGPDREIAEAGFFALDALPGGTTKATHARLSEIIEEAPPDPLWTRA